MVVNVKKVRSFSSLWTMQKISLTIFGEFTNQIFFLGGEACEYFELYFRITNLARQSVVLFSSDGIPARGSEIGARRIVEIRKKTSNQTPVTFQVKRGNTSFLLNTKPNITLLPERRVRQPTSLTIIGKINILCFLLTDITFVLSDCRIT